MGADPDWVLTVLASESSVSSRDERGAAWDAIKFTRFFSLLVDCAEVFDVEEQPLDEFDVVEVLCLFLDNSCADARLDS